MMNINLHLPDDKQLRIEKNTIISQLKYNDYIDFVSNLQLEHYISSQKERIAAIIVFSFFYPILNVSKLYEKMGMSLTTKKKDNKALTEYLNKRNLRFEVVPKKGMKVAGSERSYRILTASILVSLVEIDSAGNLMNRKANNPLQKMIFEVFAEMAKVEIAEAKDLLNKFIKENQVRMSYPSKKFCLLCLVLSLYRFRQGYMLEAEMELDLKVPNYQLFINQKRENLFFTYLAASLDYMSFSPPPMDTRLKMAVLAFINQVQDHIVTTFYDYEAIFNEVYSYIYKCYIRNKLDYNLYDKKLDDTHKVLPKLYRTVSKATPIIETKMDVQFSKLQISALTLLVRKFTMKNKVIGRNSRKIVIVSNSAIEKTSYFAENLRHHLDVTVAGTYNINELYELEHIEYDLIITFSNRIAALLAENSYSCVKLNFYLNQRDIDKLLKIGFSSSSRRKILSDHFIDEIKDKDPEEIKELLLTKYPSHFL